MNKTELDVIKNIQDAIIMLADQNIRSAKIASQLTKTVNELDSRMRSIESSKNKLLFIGRNK